MRLPVRLAALTLLPLSYASAQTPQPQPAPAPLVNQQALDKLQIELRTMKIPQIDTENLINKEALRDLIDSTVTLQNDPFFLAQLGGPMGQGMGGPDAFELRRSGPESRIAPHGAWWKNPELAQKLALTADQQKHMDEIVFENRIQLVHMKATLEEEELRLEPLLNVNPPDTAKALIQINHIADTRADLEKANARMLLGIRSVLTAQQWTQLQAEQHRPMKIDMDRMHGMQDMHDRKRSETPRRPERPQTPPPASATPPAPPSGQ